MECSSLLECQNELSSVYDTGFACGCMTDVCLLDPKSMRGKEECDGT